MTVKYNLKEMSLLILGHNPKNNFDKYWKESEWWDKILRNIPAYLEPKDLE